MWPPLCPTCQRHHLNSCQDATDNDRTWQHLSTLLDAFLPPSTPMRDVPAALRGPRWAA